MPRPNVVAEVKSLKAFRKALEAGATITEINIRGGGDGEKLTTDEIREIANGLERSGAKSLALTYHGIDKDGAEILAEALKSNKQVTTVALYGSDMGEVGSKALAKALEFSNVAVLDLSSCNVTDRGAEAFAELIKSSKTLQYVNFSDNNLSNIGRGNEGLLALSMAAKMSPSLHELELGLNSAVFTDEYTKLCKEVTENLKRNKALYANPDTAVGRASSIPLDADRTAEANR